MAPNTYNCIDVAIKEVAAFVFGSWICIADSGGGFSSYLPYLVSPSPLPLAGSPEASGDLADKLSNLMIADPISS
jgi:hypothetical protein